MVLELCDNSPIFFDVEFSEIICKNYKMKTGGGWILAQLIIFL